jgi:hypothetical protein
MAIVGRRGVRMVAVVLGVTLVAAACGDTSEDAGTAEAAATWDCGAECGWDSDAAGSGTDGDLAPVGEAMAADGARTDAASASATTAVEVARPDTAVTAGSIDDNERWEDYLLYRQWFDALAPRPAVRDIPVEGRQVLEVLDGEGRPVLGARISVRDAADEEVARLTTHADGRALFHPAPGAVDPDSQRRPTFEVVVVPPGGGEAERRALDAEARTHRVVLGAGSAEGPVLLDVALLLDATGSMGDEIDRLKANMVSVAEQIAEHPAAPDVRFALTVYRDEGDAFVTRSFGFTGDVAAFTDALREVEADGGGDWPEALEEGLAEVVGGQDWREGAVHLVFTVADAPPHLRDGGPGYDESLRLAAEEGIKVFPIASSGAADDAVTEYVFRQLAQVTLGRFVFLTYGADGAPTGDTTAHRVEPGSYDVLALDELVVRIVGDELAALVAPG